MEWLSPWHPVADPAQVAGIERELASELAPDHPLFGLSMRTLACRRDCDDVLFAVEDGSERVAVVHLTWARHPETAPWPIANLYASLTAWAAEEMRSDAEEFGP